MNTLILICALAAGGDNELISLPIGLEIYPATWQTPVKVEKILVVQNTSCEKSNYFRAGGRLDDVILRIDGVLVNSTVIQKWKNNIKYEKVYTFQVVQYPYWIGNGQPNIKLIKVKAEPEEEWYNNPSKPKWKQND
jgi:hypothetical protein